MLSGQSLSVLTVITVLGAVAPAGAPGGAERWHREPDAARDEAARLQVPILLHFYADWCGPCRRMEREVLHDQELLDQLGKTVVGVKVNCDRHQELVRQYDVRALPADVMIDVDGRILARSDGFQTKRAYLARLARVEADNARTRPVRPDAAGPALPDVLTKPSPVIAARPSDQAADRPPGTEAATAAFESAVGLQGYSPVSMAQNRKWRKGLSDFAAEYDGIVYHLATADEKSAFETEPARFAPQFLGCDPVILFETKRAVSGSIRYGAYYNGRLYLFAGRENRQRFKDDPPRFLHVHQALRIEQIEGSRLH